MAFLSVLLTYKGLEVITTIDDNNDSFTITFNSLIDPNESIIMDDIQFGKFIQHHRLLLQSIVCIHGVMMAFSNIRQYFCKDIS